MTTDKNDAILLTESFIKRKDYDGYVVDLDNILEEDSLWYVPFKELNPNPNIFLAGAYNGLIIDKNSTEFAQPGSALSLEEWMYGFKMGIRGERLDLIIEKVYDYRAATEFLERLKVQYVKIEIEGGTEWKIPNEFSRKEIKKRLDKPPCTFKNQSFTYSIAVFKRLNNEKIFKYKLVKTPETYPNVLGELIEE